MEEHCADDVMTQGLSEDDALYFGLYSRREMSVLSRLFVLSSHSARTIVAVEIPQVPVVSRYLIQKTKERTCCCVKDLMSAIYAGRRMTFQAAVEKGSSRGG